ncbi:uncharacterized protein LOC144449222 [Glandiceps talaboti]
MFTPLTVIQCLCFLLAVFAETFRETEQYVYDTLAHLEARPDVHVVIETPHRDRFRRDESGNETNYVIEEADHSYYKASYHYASNQDVMDKFWIDLDDPHDQYVQTQNSLSTNHRTAVILPISFRFPFYGHDVGRVVVATGGFIYVGPYIHKWLASTQYVAPLMANFDPSLHDYSIVRTKDNGTMFTTEWNTVYLQDHVDAGNFTFQASIYQDGKITFCYKNVAKDVSDISDRAHPVTIGLSDAFYVDEPLGGGLIQRTIYEYHSFSLEYSRIQSGSVVVMEPLPTCHQFTTCDTCTGSAIGFNCSWCEVTSKCSSGFDRHRQEWLESGCDHDGVQWHHQCPRSTTAPPTTRPKTKRATTTSATTTTTSSTLLKLTTNSRVKVTTDMPVAGVDPCLSNPCYHGSCRVDKHGRFKCDCDAGYSGILCSLNIDECASGPCLNDGKCVDEINRFACECMPGYEGEICQKIIELDYCVDVMPCLNGGSCVNKDDARGYHCTCTPDWFGKDCQKRSSDKNNGNINGNLQPAKQVQDGSTKSNVGGGLSIGGIFAILVTFCLIAVVIGWTYYAYKFPTTKSGLLLIEMRRGRCFRKKDPEEQYQVNLDKVDFEGEAEA